MSITTISLGTADRLTVLYSYPNFTGDKSSLAQTITHWFGMTLDRDGYKSQATASVRIDGSGNYFLDLTGPANLAAAFAVYAKRLPQFLANGWDAWTNVVPMLQKTGKWDPCPDGPTPPYHPWRFFLPHGMAMLNQKALLFFHYPPIRLLDVNQDYLDDPVPVRCEELLAANGVTDLALTPNEVATGDIMLFNTVMDATPIGAEDDQGSKTACDPTKGPSCNASVFDPTFGLIPIQSFPAYQKAQVSLLLNTSPVNASYTVPIVVYGAHPLTEFNTIYGTSIKNYAPVLASIVPGMKTPVLASSHPYVFYGKAQGFNNIGSGIMPAANIPAATSQMQLDLAVAGWLKAMSDDPSQDPLNIWNNLKKYWTTDPQAALTVTALVNHQGSLFYSDPTTLAFTFKTPLVWPSTAKTPLAAKSKPATTAKPSAVSKTTAVASKRTTAVGSSGLQVIGDSGTPVDWWFIYKISKESKSESPPPSTQPATGHEFLYFDSAMAKAGAKPVLSKNLIDKSGPLFDTYSQLFTPAAKQNKDLGYYCYNDEDRYEKGKTTGTGPSPCGHCKGALAFDLASDSAFWLIHSVPLLPMNAAFAYPPTGFKEAQSMLCVQLPNADASKDIADLMLKAHGPNVPVSSDLLTNANSSANNFTNPPVTNVPASLRANDPNDPRLALMANNIPNNRSSKIQPFAGQVPFTSKDGQKFLAIAKNRAWGDPKLGQPTMDFYNELVSVALNENIEVETWENAGKNDVAIPPPDEGDEKHPVENMHSVSLVPLGIPWSWAEENDHAKLAISDRTNPAGTDRWVCVGDINFTLSMEQRGGGTVAFICDPLWQALSQIILATPEKGTKAASAQPTATKPAPPTKKPAAKKIVVVKSATKQPAAKKSAPAKKAVKPKAAEKKPVAQKTTPKKKQPAVKKAASKKKPAAKKTSPKKAVRKKSAARKTVSKKKAPSKKRAAKKAPLKRVLKKAAKKTGRKIGKK